MGKSAFEEKCDILQVQRADIFQDSLEELPVHINEILDASAKTAAAAAVSAGIKTEKKMKVLNEDGELLEVIFDPVLKCYYEPTKNVYYQVKDVKKMAGAQTETNAA